MTSVSIGQNFVWCLRHQHRHRVIWRRDRWRWLDARAKCGNLYFMLQIRKPPQRSGK